jgi:PKD repeat protein
MNTYIVFALNYPTVESGAVPDPTPTWAVLTQKETEAEAVDFVVQNGVLPAHGEIHACDIAATQSFKVTTNVSLEASGGSTVPGTPPSSPVESVPPTALFTYTPSAPNRNDTVQFDASQSAPGSEPIARYDWLFGDEAMPGAGVTPTYQFTKNGDYDVVLTVTDEAELTSETTQTISI